MTKYFRVKGTALSDLIDFADATLKLKIRGLAGDDVIYGGAGNDRIDAGRGNDRVYGGGGADKLKGGSGNDFIVGGAGNDDIDGDRGIDTASYQGNFSEYALSFKRTGELKGTVTDLAAGRDGTDTLKRVEYLQFRDGLYDVANDTFYALNHAPAVSGPVNGTALEDGTLSVLDALAAASDQDLDALSVVNVPASLPAGVTYNAASHSFTLDPGNAAYQHLAAGDATVVTVTYGVTDGIATTGATASWTVTGANDAPVVTGAVTANAAEDGAGSIVNALANAGDADDNALLSVTGVPAALPPGVTFDAATHSFALDPSNAAYQHLAAGETATVTAAYGVTDGIATTAASVSWTVTGVNDAPTLDDIGVGTQQLSEAELLLNASMAFADIDLSDGHTVTITSLTPGAVGDASAVIGSDSTGSGQGQINLAYHLTAAQYEAAGGPVPDVLEYLVTLDDLHGGVVSKTISIPLAEIISGGDGGGGPNHAPVITYASTDEFGGRSVQDDPSAQILHTSGIIQFDDVDSNDPHTVQLFANPQNLGTLTYTYSNDSNDTNHTAPGNIQWDYYVAESLVRPMGGNENHDDMFTFRITDSHGAFVDKQTDVWVFGSNEAPVIQNPSFDLIGDNLGVVDRADNFVFSDADVHDAHYVATSLNGNPFITGFGQFEAYLVNDTTAGTGGLVQWTYHVDQAALNSLAFGQVVTENWIIQVSDAPIDPYQNNAGQSAFASVNVTITGVLLHDLV